MWHRFKGCATLGNKETVLKHQSTCTWFTQFDLFFFFSATEGEDRELCEGNEINNANMENCNNKIAIYCRTDRRALKANILGLC